MFTSDGVIKKERETTENTPKEVRKRRFSERGQDFPLEGFRGFEKVPLVKLLRYDITPYLHSLNNNNSGNIVAQNTSIHSKRLAQKCTVKLVNQDLVKLKETWAHRTQSATPTESISDWENGTMVNIKCKICDKRYSSEKKLLKHQENKHMLVYKPHDKPQKRVSFSDHVIVHEVKEYHKCRKCPKIFEEYKLLKSHMKELHRKRKCYICNYCKRNFVDRTFFKVHIKLHCDVCRLLLPSKAKHTVHKRDVCRSLKLHKCKTCDETYFSLMDLKDHTYEHIKNCYICDICKDEFQTKCGIAHHFSFLHSNNRPTLLYTMRNLGNERLYLCNYCEESSVERGILENHTQLLPDLSNKATTGYKDYYFCDQCLKKFDTETKMLQHKWTHFLKTCNNSQIRNKHVANNKMKTTYNIRDVLPEHMNPKVIIKKLKTADDYISEAVEFVDVTTVDDKTAFDVTTTVDVYNTNLKKPIVDPKSKKTIISRHQCQTCSKYFSSNYCLNRHIETQHLNYENLQCKVCEEMFVWPSLLKSHKCIRLNHPEMPFEDARPEIYFDNLHEIVQNGFDDLNIADNDDYLNTLDFEIPAPIVELTEYENFSTTPERFAPLTNLGYKVVVQEVPIEF